MEFKYMENTKYLLLALAGIVMACLGYLLYVLNPLELVINSMVTLRPGTFMYDLWKEPPFEILAKVYLFNVTNPQEFLAGKEKLRFEEVGPYTYQEVLTNTHGVLNENGTLTYTPKRDMIFKREYSIGDHETDTLIVPNVPLLGIGSVLSSYNFFLNIGFNSMTSSAHQFLNLTIKEYMWGYEDNLVTLANTFIPSWIDFPTFGILDRMLTLDNANSEVTLHLKENSDDPDNIIHAYSINNYNGSPGLKQWGYVDVGENETSPANTKCNTVEGSFEEGIFPRNMRENVSVRLYRRAFCRPVDFKYENTSVNQDGYKIHRYRIKETNFVSGDILPDYKCYCVKNKCAPNGFTSIAPCYYGIPITLSQPHYLRVDEKIMAQIEGMNPDIEKHDTVWSVNPDFGIPMSAHLRIQVNLHVGQTSYITKMKPFNNLMLPLCWMELDIKDMSPNLKFLLKMTLFVLPIVQDVLMWLLGILGIAMVAAAALIVFYFPPERRLEDPFGHRIGYSPILVIPLSSRLKADQMRIS